MGKRDDPDLLQITWVVMAIRRAASRMLVEEGHGAVIVFLEILDVRHVVD